MTQVDLCNFHPAKKQVQRDQEQHREGAFSWEPRPALAATRLSPKLPGSQATRKASTLYAVLSQGMQESTQQALLSENVGLHAVSKLLHY